MVPIQEARRRNHVPGAAVRAVEDAGARSCQPALEKTSMLDEDGNLDFDTVLHSWRKGLHSARFIEKRAAYCIL